MITQGEVIYTGANYYQLPIGDKIKEVKSGDKVSIAIDQCYKLMKTGFFAATCDTWNKIITQDKYNDPSGIEGMLKGQRCFIIAGGPSLKGFDLSKLDNEFTLAINWSLNYYMKAKACLFIDLYYAQKNKELLNKYNGLIFGSFRCAELLPSKKNVYLFPQNNSNIKLSLGEGLYNGNLSGVAALSLALIMGAEEIYLLGYDLSYDNGHHWYGTADKKQDLYPECNLSKKVGYFDKFIPYKDRIFNCSETSIIKCFEYKDIEGVLKTTVEVKPKLVEIKKPVVIPTAITRTYPTSDINKLQSINGKFKDQRCFVIGSGASLKGFDFNQLNNELTIAVNHSIEHYKKAKIHLFGDPRVLDYTLKDDNNFEGMIFCSSQTDISKIANKEKVYVFEKNVEEVTDALEDGLYSDFNSGMEAVNLALVMGCNPIYLLGFDFCAKENEYYYYGKPEWFKTNVGYCDKLLQSRVKFWDKFNSHKHKIYNCSAISKIEIFKKVKFKDIINESN
jgi:hypothetical protein